jgi:hypothetical protein
MCVTHAGIQVCRDAYVSTCADLAKKGSITRGFINACLWKDPDVGAFHNYVSHELETSKKKKRTREEVTVARTAAKKARREMIEAKKAEASLSKAEAEPRAAEAPVKAAERQEPVDDDDTLAAADYGAQGYSV